MAAHHRHHHPQAYVPAGRQGVPEPWISRLDGESCALTLGSLSSWARDGSDRIASSMCLFHGHPWLL
jgi:hypothetical protein